MTRRTSLLRVAAIALPALLGACFDEPPLPASGLPVFTDAFTTGFTPNPFDTAVSTSLKIDGTTAHSGSASIRLDVPAAASGYSGGAVLASQPQDLSGCNALLFWTKASRAGTLDDLGYGLSFTGSKAYQSEVAGLPLTTEWTRHAVPIPDSSRLTTDGMLWWVDVDASGYTVWLDDVVFDRIDPALLQLQPAVLTDTATLPVTQKEQVGLRLRYTDLDGTQRSLDSTAVGTGPAPAFFSFESSNPSVVSVDATGKMTAVAVGSATVTARLAGALADGAVTVNVVATAPTEPTAAATTPPTRSATDVVSLYTSGAVYANKTVDSWYTSWSVGGGYTTPTISGTSRVVKKYSAIRYAGVDIQVTKLDLSAMTTMHVDLWTPDATSLTVKLVAFNGTTNIGEKAVSFGSSTIKRWRWVSLDIPLSSFSSVVDLTRVGQIVWVTDPNSATATGTFFVDNVYFYR
jgi:hypothetical protein